MNNIEYFEIIKGASLFQNMTDAEIKEVINAMQPRKRSFCKNSIIAYEGDKVSELGIVLSGKVYLIRDSINGKTTLLDTRSPSEYTGLLNIAGGYKLRFNIKSASDNTEILYIVFY